SQVFRIGEIRRQTNPVRETSIHDGDNRSSVFVGAGIIRSSRVIEAEVSAPSRNGDRRGRRLVPDVVQMADDDVMQVRTGCLEDVDLIKSASRASIRVMRADREASTHVGFGGGL